MVYPKKKHDEISILINTISLILISTVTLSRTSAFQAIHVLDPGIQDFKYYSSWNSDQWIQWIRNRYIQDLNERRVGSFENGSQKPLNGKIVNIVIVASPEEINSAFSELSNQSYTNGDEDFLWSDISFPVFVIMRKSNEGKENQDEDITTQSSYFNVFNCSKKKMYINARVDLSNFTPITIKHLFPKKVKNPKDTLRIPLVTCTKVGQARGLLDEIKFQLKGN